MNRYALPALLALGAVALWTFAAFAPLTDSAIVIAYVGGAWVAGLAALEFGERLVAQRRRRHPNSHPRRQ